MKVLKRTILALLAILLLGAGGIFLYLRSTLPKARGLLRIDGLQRPVQISRNRWGVPHIQALTLEDMVLAIGFVHAQDRLFQMDLSRRSALGRLSEVFGRRTLPLDRGQKQQLVEESIRLTEKAISPPLRVLAECYCRGVNLCIDTQPLPPEFRLLRYRPEKWKIQDILAIFKNMESMLADDGGELTNLKLAEILGEEKVRSLQPRPLGRSIMRNEEASPFFSHPALEEALRKERERGEQRLGSNNWVLAGSRTLTGLPLLANDPHLPNRFPSYFYQIQAEANDLEWCGNTLPGIPFIIIGRNRDIGWGFTNIGTDVTDYFRLTINPDNPQQYRYNGKWEPFDIVKQAILVRGQEPVFQTVKRSAFGPVYEEKPLVLAEHSIARYPATVMDAFYEMNLSTSIGEFMSALKKFSSPAQNVVFADHRGNIGYYPAGRVPSRARGDGAFPVPGEGSDDQWTGFLDEDRKPYLLNPHRGFIATANNPVLPESAPLIFSRSAPPSFRADRIEEVLQAKEKLGLGDMRRLQTDTLLPSARFLISELAGLEPRSAKAASVLQSLRRWNFRVDQGEAPYLFYLFERRLAENIFLDHFPQGQYARLVSTSWVYRLLGYPEGKSKRMADFEEWVDDRRTQARESFADIAIRSLEETHDQAEPEPGRRIPTWEEVHTIGYTHPLGSAWILRPLLNRGPYPMAGGKECIMSASFEGENFGEITYISTFRMILDFSDFSRSLLINSSGQSGHFLSPWYADQIPLYIQGQYRPMEEAPESARAFFLQPR